MEWSQKTTLLFIDHYRNKPILWDPQDFLYYNKSKKQDSWQELADEFEISVEECKRKMTSLLASFRRERAKARKSKRCGKVYCSNWFAFKPLAFAMNRTRSRSASNSMETINITTPRENQIEVPKKLKVPTQKPEDLMASALSILNANQKPQSAIDECESFGIFVSNKLKNYSRRTRNSVQHCIANVLFEADQGGYEINQSQNCSSSRTFGSHTPQSTQSDESHLLDEIKPMPIDPLE